MNKVSKKIGSILCIAVLTLSGTALVSAAGNITDTGFTFSFSGIGNKHQYTSAREKRDATSMYMKVNDISGINQFKIEPFALDRKGNRHYNSKSDTKIIKSTGVYYIKNYVYEDGYSKGGLHAYRDYWDGGRSSGLWSPDSI